MKKEIEITPEMQEIIDKQIDERVAELKTKAEEYKSKVDDVAQAKALAIADEMFTKERTLSVQMKEFQDQRTQLEWLQSQGALPKDEKAWQTLMKLRMWKQMGMTEYEAINGIAFVNGRMSVWWEVMMWMIARAWYKIEFIKSDDSICEVKITNRSNWENAIEKYTIDEAKKSWLYPANPYSPWTKFTKLMLRYKAIRNCSKFFCPEVLGWMITTEEAQTELPEYKEIKVEAINPEENNELIQKINNSKDIKELQSLAPEIKKAGSQEIIKIYSYKIQELWSK